MTQPDLFAAVEADIDGTDFTATVARYFRAHPGQWVDGHTLMQIGGAFAFRTRVSECRRRYGMTITNRWRTEKAPSGRLYRVTEYRWVTDDTRC